MALLAPSGMGKSQLLRCIAGLKKPDTGAVYLNEDRQLTKAGMVGVVAQDYPLFMFMTARDNILIAARRKFNAKEAAGGVDALLERFGLLEHANKYPHQLSGGQRQRVSILQQMVCSGHLLLMDEPFSGLDINVKEEVQRLITGLAAANELNSVIITTHDIQSAVAVADTIVILGRQRDEKGEIIPGANIVETYNLMDEGLAWRPNIQSLPAFHAMEVKIRQRFLTL